jgi:hypothetical protein
MKIEDIYSLKISFKIMKSEKLFKYNLWVTPRLFLSLIIDNFSEDKEILIYFKKLIKTAK